jgi:hypothetical protein
LSSPGGGQAVTPSKSRECEATVRFEAYSL